MPRINVCAEPCGSGAAPGAEFRLLHLFCPVKGAFTPGAFTPVLAKHFKNFSIEDSFAIGVDRIQRNFEPLKRQIEK